MRWKRHSFIRSFWARHCWLIGLLRPVNGAGLFRADSHTMGWLQAQKKISYCTGNRGMTRGPWEQRTLGNSLVSGKLDREATFDLSLVMDETRGKRQVKSK